MTDENKININCTTNWTHGRLVYFKSEEIAQKAVAILGEEVIKLALCTDY